jgi:hypothetical protein
LRPRQQRHQLGEQIGDLGKDRGNVGVMDRHVTFFPGFNPDYPLERGKVRRPWASEGRVGQEMVIRCNTMDGSMEAMKARAGPMDDLDPSIDGFGIPGQGQCRAPGNAGNMSL